MRRQTSPTSPRLPESARTTIYEYFTDKEDVLVNLVEDAVPSVLAGMLADLPEDHDMQERLAELLIQRGLNPVSTDHALGSMVMRDLPTLSPGAAARVRCRPRPDRARDPCGLCPCGIPSLEFRSFEPEDAARLVYGVMMAASQALLAMPMPSSECTSQTTPWCGSCSTAFSA